MSPAPVEASTWHTLTMSLADRLCVLSDGEFVTLAAAGGGPFVQALALGPHLYLECVGSTSFGGLYAWTPEQEAALSELGWIPELEFGNAVYRNGLPPESHLAAAQLLVASLRDVGGLIDPADIVVSVG